MQSTPLDKSLRPLLAFFAHPDDEAYSSAALLALSARRGRPVYIVCATRGDGGGPDGDHKRALAQTRSAELAAACQVLGAQPPIFLEWQDGHLDALTPSDAIAEIALLLKQWDPAVVLTLGKDGAYGHLDHILLTQFVDAAFHHDPTRRERSRLVHTLFARGVFRPVMKALRRFRGVKLHHDLGLDDLGEAPTAADYHLEVGALKAIKCQALGAHRSQLPRGEIHRFLRPGLFGKLLHIEYYKVVSGVPLPPRAPHLFVNLP